MVASWLSLAATPTFAAMALATALMERGGGAALCLPAGGSPLSGMTLMYLLMSAFHAPAWLRLIRSQD